MSTLHKIDHPKNNSINFLCVKWLLSILIKNVASMCSNATRNVYKPGNLAFYFEIPLLETEYK